MESPWHTRSEAASAPPSLDHRVSTTGTRMVSTDRHNARRDRLNTVPRNRSLSGGIHRTVADGDYRPAAARFSGIAEQRGVTRRGDSAVDRTRDVTGRTDGGGGFASSRQIDVRNRPTAVTDDWLRQGIGAAEQGGATTQTYSSTAATRDRARRTVGGDFANSRQLDERNRPTVATNDWQRQGIDATEQHGATVQTYSVAGGLTVRERSDERVWPNVDRPIPMTTDSRFDSSRHYATSSFNVVSDLYPNTAYSQSNVVMMPVHYARPNDIVSPQVRPIVSINTGLVGSDPRNVVDVARQRGVVPHRLDDGSTYPKVVEIDEGSRDRGVDLSARSPVGYRDFNFSSGRPDSRGPRQTESHSRYPDVPDIARPGVVMAGAGWYL